MSERPPVGPALAAQESPTGAETPAPPRATGAGTFVTASHHSLFSVTPVCSVCSDPMGPTPDEGTSPFAVQGRGLLLFSRGEERRAEEPLICEDCNTAVGIAALQSFHGNEGEE